MRPTSYKYHEKICGNCYFHKDADRRYDSLCFFGDNIDVNSDELSIMDDDEYEKIWVGRVVDWCGTCDEFRRKDD